MIGCTSNPTWTNPCHLTTDTAKEDALTCQDHATNPIVAEAPATIGGRHPSPHPSTAAAYNTHQPNDTLDNIITKTHCTGTATLCPSHVTFPVRVTLETISWTEANLVWDPLIICPTDHTHRRHQSHIHKQQSLVDLTARRRLPFRTHNWTLPQNHIMTYPLNY